jgi:hypothetical protein
MSRILKEMGLSKIAEAIARDNARESESLNEAKKSIGGKIVVASTDADDSVKNFKALGCTKVKKTDDFGGNEEVHAHWSEANAKKLHSHLSKNYNSLGPNNKEWESNDAHDEIPGWSALHKHVTGKSRVNESVNESSGSYAAKYAAAPEKIKKVADEFKRLKSTSLESLKREARTMNRVHNAKTKDEHVGLILSNKFSDKTLQDHDDHFLGKSNEDVSLTEAFKVKSPHNKFAIEMHPSKDFPGQWIVATTPADGGEKNKTIHESREEARKRFESLHRWSGVGHVKAMTESEVEEAQEENVFEDANGNPKPRHYRKAAIHSTFTSEDQAMKKLIEQAIANQLKIRDERTLEESKAPKVKKAKPANYHDDDDDGDAYPPKDVYNSDETNRIFGRDEAARRAKQKDRTGKTWKVGDEEVEEANESAENSKFKVGQHIVSHGGDHPSLYGQVERLDTHHAHVKMEDGSKVKIRHSNGARIVPSESHGGFGSIGEMSPDEHRAASKKHEEEWKAEWNRRNDERHKDQAPKDREMHIRNRLGRNHGLSVEHAKAIHDILDKAGHPRDERDEDYTRKSNPHYGL